MHQRPFGDGTRLTILSVAGFVGAGLLAAHIANQMRVIENSVAEARNDIAQRVQQARLQTPQKGPKGDPGPQGPPGQAADSGAIKALLAQISNRIAALEKSPAPVQKASTPKTHETASLQAAKPACGIFAPPDAKTVTTARVTAGQATAWCTNEGRVLGRLEANAGGLSFALADGGVAACVYDRPCQVRAAGRIFTILPQRQANDPKSAVLTLKVGL